jgi:predicted RNA-binding protein YlxR (DUF448 family)
MKTTRVNAKQPQYLKHIPQRTCIACREAKPKRELVRLVHTTDGTVEIDSSGKKAGRGAYLCYKFSCWEKSLKKSYLDRALRTNPSLDNREQLAELGKTLCSNHESKAIP